MSQCWRFSGKLYVENQPPGNSTQVFACGNSANFGASHDGGGGILYKNAFLDGNQIDIGGVPLDPTDDYPSPLHLVSGTESLVSVSSDQDILPGIRVAGSCNGCQIKYDCLNGECIEQTDYGTPGLYHSLADCQMQCGDGEVKLSSTSVIILTGCDPVTGNPVFHLENIQVLAGTEAAQQLLFEQIANTQGEVLCKADTVAAIPSGWPLRPEYQRPQVIYQFAEINENGVIIGAPKYPITVPHHLPDKPDVALPNFQRGNWEIIYVLNDNSKVTIHSLDEANGMMVLEVIKGRIDPEKMVKSYLSKSSLVVTTSAYQEITVKNRLAKYYSTGARNGLPDWLKKW